MPRQLIQSPTVNTFASMLTSAEIGRILAMPDIREKLVARGVEPYIATADQFAAMPDGPNAPIVPIIAMVKARLRKPDSLI